MICSLFPRGNLSFSASEPLLMLLLSLVNISHLFIAYPAPSSLVQLTSVKSLAYPSLKRAPLSFCSICCLYYSFSTNNLLLFCEISLSLSFSFPFSLSLSATVSLFLGPHWSVSILFTES